MAASYDFVQFDVFTQTPLAGNPLAIFTDARGLTDKQMQALAREMNLSETTFILPREPSVEAREGKRVRIFTVEEELPFAGHPTLGTALYIYSTISSSPDQIVLDLNAGKIPVTFRADSEKAGLDHADGQVFGQMQQRDPEFGPVLSREKIAEELGLNVDDLDPEWPIQVVSTGFPFAIVPFRNSKRLAKFQPDIAKARRLLDGTEARFFYFICAERMENRDVRARMFFYGGRMCRCLDGKIRNREIRRADIHSSRRGSRTAKRDFCQRQVRRRSRYKCSRRRLCSGITPRNRNPITIDEL
jgi:trans-2,3-dihydro-3-hydroxyanthranilate isomerase